MTVSDDQQSCLYECVVQHRRLSPRAHAFSARILLFYLDLDELGPLNRNQVIGYGRRAWYEFRDEDHFPYPGSTLKERVCRYIADRGVTRPVGRVKLLTLLRTAGYIFHPASFFYVFDSSGQPLAALVQVTNTFLEQKVYFLGPDTFRDGAFRQRHSKDFYISPFMDLRDDMDFCLGIPGDKVSISSDVDMASAGRQFFASVTGARMKLNRGALAWMAWKHPLDTFKVIGLIYWHAVRLALKGVPFFWKDENYRYQRDYFRGRHERSIRQ